MTTNTNTTKRTATKRASTTKRDDAPALSQVEIDAGKAIADVMSGKVTPSEGLAVAASLRGTAAKRTLHDTIAWSRVVGTVAIVGSGLKPDPKGKVPAVNAIVDAFLKSADGKDCGYGSSTLRAYVKLARIENVHTVLTLWEKFSAEPLAVASDRSAYDTAQSYNAVIRFADAWREGRVDPDTGVIFATKRDAASDDGKTRQAVSDAQSAAATERSVKAHKRAVAKVKAEASASDAMIGNVRVADVAALTKAQRAKLANLLKSLD